MTRRTSRRATPACRSATGRLVVYVGRLGSAPQEIRLSGRSTTVEAVLRAANINVEGRMRLSVNGIVASKTSRVKNGDLVGVVTPKQAGR